MDCVSISKFEVLWGICLSIVLIAGMLSGAILGLAPGQLILCAWGAYVLVAACWLPDRAAAVGAQLNELCREDEANPGRPAGLLRHILAHLALPAYFALLCLVTGSFLQYFTLRPPLPILAVVWYFLMFAMLALLGVAATLVTVLVIRRKVGSARWLAQFIAQLTGASALIVAGISIPAGLELVVPRNGISTWWKTDYPFSWYGLAIDARLVWFGATAVLIVFGFGSTARLLRARSEAPRLPWVMPLFLVLMLGLLCGASSITGPYLSHWIVGSFVMARLATYVIFVCEPKNVIDLGWMAERLRDGHVLDALRCMPGWVSAYLLTTALGGIALAHHLASGQFGMLVHPLLNELTMPLGLSSRFWSYYVAFWLFLTRDILFLLWLSLSRPGRWNDLLGIVALLLVLLLASSARGLGFGFLMPVLVPGFVLEPVDLLGPVLTVLGLLLLILRAWPVRLRFA